MATEKFRLDLVPGRTLPTVHVSQYDVGTERELRALLYWDGEPYQASSDMTAVLHGTNRRGHGFDIECALLSSEKPSSVIFYPQKELTYLAGLARCKIELKRGDNIIGTGAFTLAVDRAGRENDTPIITDAQNLLDVNDAIAKANEAKEAAAASAAAALEAQHAAENAAAESDAARAKASADEAGKNATAASDSATAASGSASAASGSASAAAKSATNAGNAESNAKSSATSAAGSAKTASDKATAASNSASAAAKSASDAKAAADSIPAAIAGKGDGLEYDKTTQKLYLTSGGKRIGNGVTIQTEIKLTYTDNDAGGQTVTIG